MTTPSDIWKGRGGWGAAGFALGAAAIAIAWSVVGARTPPTVDRPADFVLPSRTEPAPPLDAARPLMTPPPPGAAAQPLASAAIDQRLPADPPATQTQAPAAEPAAPVVDPATRPAVGLNLINLNTAPAAELDLLPGIGPALAGRIIDERERGGRFTSLQDFQRVRGIGPRTAEKLEGLVSFE